MAVGPVDVYIIGFPGNKFSGRIAPAIMELVENGTIRVLDLLFVMKDADGVVTTLAADGHRRGRRRLRRDRRHAAGRARGRGCRGGQRRPAGQQLGPPDRVREHLGGKVVDALRAADAVLIDSIRIPADVVEAVSRQARPRHFEIERKRHGTSTYGSPHRRRRGNRHRRVRARAAPSVREICRAGPAAYDQQQAQNQQAPPPSREDDTTAQLQNLAQLHNQGVLTDEEFAAAKAKILGI